jgi:hypothetical protein
LLERKPTNIQLPGKIPAIPVATPRAIPSESQPTQTVNATGGISTGKLLFGGCFLVVATMFATAAAGALVYVYLVPEQVIAPKVIVNPAEHYREVFADGSHKAWSLALEKFDAEEFRDWKDMDEFLKPLLAEVVATSERPGIEAIESINGKLWVAQNDEQKAEVKANRAAARQVIQAFVDGYE